MRSTTLVASLAVIALFGVACGDDEKFSGDPVNSESPSGETTVAEAPATDAPDVIVNPDPVIVNLSTGVLRVNQQNLAAGTINFEATNTEALPHVFAIAAGEGYESLPLLANGAVDLDALGDAFRGSTGLLMPGLGPTKVLTVDLEPGTYVLFCNGGDDPEKGEVSHASEGEYVVITVV